MKAIALFRALRVLLLAVLLPVTSAAAQQKGAIIGEILDAVDGSPLIKVTVTIQGTKLKAVTDSLGTFRIEGVEAGDVTIRFQKAGYASLAEPVVVHDGWTTGVRFELAPTKVLLDALRVQAGGTPVPVDVAGGKRAEVRPKDTSGTPTTMLDAIGTQVPGVMVMKPSGEVGRGSRVMIRGPSSI
ncbi:MAG: carboxypeptidase-like regulatory domain-containing protein, partial [Longimicrobiales bacterium]